ncbi:MAG: hypothetical protein H8D23_27995 [Candidatus Brocadiales bacterium]|nr:hypothetical protein [Candidatus Brocadiales bacterium]
MKILSTIFVTMTLLVIGFLFLSSGVNNLDSNVSKSSVKKTQDDEYSSKFKRRDFIRERRENERKEMNRTKNVSKVDAERDQGDFMVYNHERISYDDFR